MYSRQRENLGLKIYPSLWQRKLFDNLGFSEKLRKVLSTAYCTTDFSIVIFFYVRVLHIRNLSMRIVNKLNCFELSILMSSFYVYTYIVTFSTKSRLRYVILTIYIVTRTLWGLSRPHLCNDIVIQYQTIGYESIQDYAESGTKLKCRKNKFSCFGTTFSLFSTISLVDQ